MALEIIVRVLREKDEPNGKVIGISLIAQQDLYSKDFVRRFFEAMHQKNASLQNRAVVKIADDKVVFEGLGFGGYRTKFEFKPKPDEFDGLKTSIFSKKYKVKLKRDGGLTPGFRITIQD